MSQSETASSNPVENAGNEQPQAVPINPPALVSLAHEQSVMTSLVLANAVELVTSVTQRVLGHEVADSFGGASLTKEMISQMAQSVFNKEITKVVGE